jgi:hypothetical protein
VTILSFSESSSERTHVFLPEKRGPNMMRRSPTLRRSAIRPCLAAFAVLLFVGGCATAPVLPIQTLLDDPARFDGESVRIVGDVESAIGALGLGTYEMNDGTGTLRVVSESGGAPREGAHVGVQGTFRSAYTLGTDALSVLVEKERFTP